MKILQKYVIGVDFSQEQYDKWLSQLTWWVTDRMPNVADPKLHASKILNAARYGTKLNGEPWKGVSQDFFKRVIALCGFDVQHGVGVRDPFKSSGHLGRPKGSLNKLNADEVPPINMTEAITLRDQYTNDLLAKYPHLDTPVYKPKVEELSETIVKSRMISADFVAAKGKALADLSKIRESLHKQIGELMEFLEISPKQRVTKTLDAKNADVGSLIAKLESYGETWHDFERLDALRELLQLYKMLKSERPDGTPQLNDWELWHMTRSRAFKFTCRHGETYELIAGFTPEEIENALLQAQKVYGFGLEPIETTTTSNLSQVIQQEPDAAEDMSVPNNDPTD